MKPTCKWKNCNDEYYETECGECWCFSNGDLKSNKVKYCPYCGKEIWNITDIAVVAEDIP